MNLFDMYFSYVKDTEPPLIFHRWSFIGGTGALLGRGYWLPFGQWRIFPNQYIMLIGNPGTRKSTAIKGVTKLLKSVGYTTFAATKTTKEGFLADLAEQTKHGANELLLDDLEDKTPREVLIAADEFNEFIGAGNLEFISTLGTLWDWDDSEYPYSTGRANRKNKTLVYQPTVSILGGNTHSSFCEAFPPQAVGQGFLSRLILIHGEESSKKITFPVAPDPDIALTLQRMLGRMKAEVSGPARIQSNAKAMLDTIYRSWNPLEDPRFSHYSTRRFTHLLKLCLIVSACDISTIISPEHVLVANSILSYAETRMPKALGEFGKSKNMNENSVVMEVLNEAKSAMPLTDIWKKVNMHFPSVRELAQVLEALKHADKVQYLSGAGGGFLPKHRVQEAKQLYVDFNLLKEFQI